MGIISNPNYFHILYKLLKEFADEYKNLNANALLEKWDLLAPQLRNILQSHYKIKTFINGWADEIESMLVVLKLMPAKQVGRNVVASEHTFNNSMEKLLQFVKVSCNCFIH